MGLESPTFVNDLVATNPLGSDQKLQGDDHIRNIKLALKNTFPGATRAVKFTELPGAVVVKAANYTVVAADAGVLFDASGTFTLALTAAATLGASFGFRVFNSGSGVITIDPAGAELINGAATIALTPGEFATVTGTGTAWIASRSGSVRLDATNTFTQPQSFTSVDAGAAEVVAADLFRDSATPAANDLLMSATWSGRSSTGVKRTLAKILAKLLDPTNGAEVSELSLWTILAGAANEVVRFGQGLYTPTLTDKGAGTINGVALYSNGVQVPATLYATKAGNYTPVQADNGGILHWTVGGFNANLPTAASVGAGFRVTLLNTGGAEMTIDPNGTELLDGLATRKLRTLDRVTIMSDGVSAWRTISGTYSFRQGSVLVDNASVTNVAHGIGKVPSRVELTLVCISGELGYAAADRVPMNGGYADQASAAAGVQLVVDATNLSVLQATVQVKVLNRTTPASAVVITTASWNFEVAAFDEY